MAEIPPELPPDVSFPVTYERFSGKVRNEELKGKGRLTVHGGGTAFTFSGKERKSFGAREREVVFTADDIFNVTVSGAMVSFRIMRAQTQRRSGSFAFFASGDEAARGIAALLPARVDPEHAAARDFYSRLNALAAPAPWLSPTNVLIGLNVVVFIVMGCLGAGWFAVESMRPYELYGANNGAATTGGEWWRLVTSMFMHFGLMHLVLNMWALYQSGHLVEKLLGRAGFVLAYLASGIAGGFASILWHRDQVWSAGASGAIFGVYGAVLGYVLREKRSLPASVFQPMAKSTVLFAAYNLVYGLKAGIDNSCHVGGVVAGVLFGWLLALPVDAEIRRQRAARTLAVAGAVLGVMILAGVAGTPRFGYNLRDELAWVDCLKPFVAQESDLLRQHQGLMEKVDRGDSGAAEVKLLGDELIPFYEKFDHSVTALSLHPGLATDRRRAALDEIFRDRIASYGRLLDGLRNQKPEAVQQYYRDEERINAALGALAKH